MGILELDSAGFRVFDGDHNFAAWGTGIVDTMTYMDPFLAKPQ